MRWKNKCKQAYLKAFGKSDHYNRMAIEGTASLFIEDAVDVLKSHTQKLNLDEKQNHH